MATTDGHFDLTPEQFEALYEQCEGGILSGAKEFIPTERRWPRDFRILTPDQDALIHKRPRILVQDATGAFFTVAFMLSSTK